MATAAVAAAAAASSAASSSAAAEAVDAPRQMLPIAPPQAALTTSPPQTPPQAAPTVQPPQTPQHAASTVSPPQPPPQAPPQAPPPLQMPPQAAPTVPQTSPQPSQTSPQTSPQASNKWADAEDEDLEQDTPMYDGPPVPVRLQVISRTGDAWVVTQASPAVQDKALDMVFRSERLYSHCLLT